MTGLSLSLNPKDRLIVCEFEVIVVNITLGKRQIVIQLTLRRYRVLPQHYAAIWQALNQY